MNKLMELGRSKKVRVAAFVLAPGIIYVLWALLFSTPGYEAELDVLIESDSQVMSPSLELGLMALGSEPTKRDALIVEKYIRSRSMLELLVAESGLMEHYTSDGVNVFQRFPESGSREDFHKYFLRRVDTYVDDDSHVLHIAVVAYDRQFSAFVLSSIIRLSEEFVNNIAQHLAKEKLAFVKSEVDAAHRRVKDASSAVLQFQQTSDTFDPQKEAEALSQVISGLLQEKVKTEAQIKGLEGYLQASAPELLAAQRRLQALEDQIYEERAKLLGVDGVGVNELWAQYQDSQIEAELAMELYRNALASLEASRLDAARQGKFLIAMGPATAPDESRYPRAGYMFVSIVVLSIILYLLVMLFAATIRDHRE